MSSKRERHQIVHDILKAIGDKNGSIRPTHVLYKANLSHQMMEEYLEDLLKKGFISEKKDKRSRTYRLEKKGFDYLEKYKVITQFIDSFGLD